MLSNLACVLIPPSTLTAFLPRFLFLSPLSLFYSVLYFTFWQHLALVTMSYLQGKKSFLLSWICHIYFCILSPFLSEASLTLPILEIWRFFTGLSTLNSLTAQFHPKFQSLPKKFPNLPVFWDGSSELRSLLTSCLLDTSTWISHENFAFVSSIETLPSLKFHFSFSFLFFVFCQWKIPSSSPGCSSQKSGFLSFIFTCIQTPSLVSSAFTLWLRSLTSIPLLLLSPGHSGPVLGLLQPPLNSSPLLPHPLLFWIYFVLQRKGPVSFCSPFPRNVHL